VCLLLYVGVYLVLSATGRYQPDMSGRRRWSFGLALIDVDHWQPRGMYFRGFINVRGEPEVDANVLGWVYAPMIWLDRWLVHPSHEILDLRRR
jgi:hypothetical protein